VVIARGHSSGIAEASKIHSLKRGQMGYCGSAVDRHSSSLRKINGGRTLRGSRRPDYMTVGHGGGDRLCSGRDRWCVWSSHCATFI